MKPNIKIHINAKLHVIIIALRGSLIIGFRKKLKFKKRFVFQKAGNAEHGCFILKKYLEETFPRTTLPAPTDTKVEKIPFLALNDPQHKNPGYGPVVATPLSVIARILMSVSIMSIEVGT